MKSVAKIELEASRNQRLLNTGWHTRLGQLAVLVVIHHRIISLVPRDFARLPLHVRNVLHTYVRAASRRLDLHLLHLGLLTHLAQSLLHLTLHLILEILNILRHLSVLRHEVVLLRQLREVVVLQLIGRLTTQIVLLLTENGTGRVFRYMGHQSVQLGERLIARVAMVMIFTLQLAERPAAALFRPVEGVRRGRAGGWKNRRLCNGKVRAKYRQPNDKPGKRRTATTILPILRETQFKARKLVVERDTNLGARKFAWIARRPEVRVHSAVH